MLEPSDTPNNVLSSGFIFLPSLTTTVLSKTSVNPRNALFKFLPPNVNNTMPIPCMIYISLLYIE